MAFRWSVAGGDARRIVDGEQIHRRRGICRPMQHGTDEAGRMEEHLADGTRFGIVGGMLGRTFAADLGHRDNRGCDAPGILSSPRRSVGRFLHIRKVPVGNGKDDLCEQRNEAQQNAAASSAVAAGTSRRRSVHELSPSTDR